MSATVRVLANTGDPVVGEDGAALAGAKIVFSLVSVENNKQISLFDVVSGEYVAGTPEEVTTDASGLFSLSLWPNNRGEVDTNYKVSITGITGVVIKPFYIRVEDGTGPLSFAAAREAYESPEVLTESLATNIANQIAEHALTPHGSISPEDMAVIQELLDNPPTGTVQSVNGVAPIAGDVTIPPTDISGKEDVGVAAGLIAEHLLNDPHSTGTGEGTVQSVNGELPDVNGNITIAGLVGPPGSDGSSAYEVAVANGYSGTEQQWLDSLVSTIPGPPSDVAGPAGLSAYEVAVAEGFPGTEADWLLSLVSTVPGPPGYTPVLGEDYFNGQDGADSFVMGPPGPPGDPATNIITSVNGQTGVVTLTAADVGALSDTTSIPSAPTYASFVQMAYEANPGVTFIITGTKETGTDPPERSATTQIHWNFYVNLGIPESNLIFRPYGEEVSGNTINITTLKGSGKIGTAGLSFSSGIIAVASLTGDGKIATVGLTEEGANELISIANMVGSGNIGTVGMTFGGGIIAVSSMVGSGAIGTVGVSEDAAGPVTINARTAAGTWGTLYYHTYDPLLVTWLGVRLATSATSSTTTALNVLVADNDDGDGGVSYDLSRAVIEFDLTDVTETIATATLELNVIANINGLTIIPLNASKVPGVLSLVDYGYAVSTTTVDQLASGLTGTRSILLHSNTVNYLNTNLGGTVELAFKDTVYDGGVTLTVPGNDTSYSSSVSTPTSGSTAPKLIITH